MNDHIATWKAHELGRAAAALGDYRTAAEWYRLAARNGATNSLVAYIGMLRMIGDRKGAKKVEQEARQRGWL